MRVRLAGIWFVTILTLAGGGPAIATEAEIDREDGYLTAFAYLPFPEGARLQLDPRDDAADDLALLATFQRALAQRGRTVDPAANLVLTFDLVQEEDFAMLDRRGGRRRNPAMSLGKTDARVEFGIDPEPRFSLVVPLGDASGTLARPLPGDVAPYCLAAAVSDRRDRQRIWSAELRFVADYYNHIEAARAMVPVLLDALGQTVGRLSITYQ